MENVNIMALDLPASKAGTNLDKNNFKWQDKMPKKKDSCFTTHSITKAAMAWISSRHYRIKYG